MNKKVYILATLFSLFLIMFASCGDDDDDDNYAAWREYNQTVFDNAASKYTSLLNSQSGNGYVRFNKVSSSDSNFTKMTQDGTIQYSDSVTVYYEGWFVYENGTKYVFDSTIDNNNVAETNAVSFFVDGYATILQTMKAGDEVEICVPYKLGYGSSGTTNSTTGAVIIPPYTTLFYNIKVLSVIPCNPNEFN